MDVVILGSRLTVLSIQRASHFLCESTRPVLPVHGQMICRSGEGSTLQTPRSDHRSGRRLSSRPTPPVQAARSRSRVAATLRNETEMGTAELSNIEEGEEEQAREQAIHRPQPVPIQSTVMVKRTD